MSKYDFFNISDLSEEDYNNNDVYLENDILAKSKYIPFSKDYADMLSKWDINGVYLDKSSNSEINNNTIDYDFETFLNEYKMFSKIYFDCVEKMKTTVINFKKTNFAQKSDFNAIVNNLHDISTHSSTSILNILNIQTYKKENEFYVRLVNVSMISMMIANSLKLDNEQIRKIGLGGLLYDIGMIKVPDNILNKFGSLNQDEYVDMKKHTVYGYKIIKNILRLDEETALIALTHHEYYGGKGYPRNLSENQIDIYSRIVAIAQAMEGMLRNFNVHFRSRISLSEAIREIMRESPSKFDPRIVKVFVNVISLYPVGSIVILNDNRRGMVFFTNRHYPMRPLIKIVSDADERFIKDGESINLLDYRDVYIKQIETNPIFLKHSQEEFFGANFMVET